MALAALATVADLTARGVTVVAEEEPLVVNYLATASSAVREAAGCPISEVTSTVQLEGPCTAWLHLPAPPVTAVSEVLLDGEPVTDWRLVSGQLWRAGGWRSGYGPSLVDVTQTHGLPDVPADIVDLVCRIAAATLVAYRSEESGEGLAAKNVASEHIGDYSVSYGDEGRITEVELPQYLRERLAARFGGGAGLVGSR